MQVTEQGLATSGHADRTERWYLLVLLLFADALGCHQREGMWILALMISEELRLAFPNLGYVLASFGLASTAGFLLMAVFIWRKKSWLGYAVLGILGGLGALLTGVSSGVGGLIVARGIAGLAYGGLLVGLYRIVGGWLPRKSHGLAIGLVFAVTHSMMLLTPLITAVTATHIGWRWSSQVMAALWCLWVLLWIWLSRRSGDTLRSESHLYPVTLAQIFKDPVTWAVVVGVSLATPLLSFRSGQLLGQASELLKGDRPAARWEFALVVFLPAIGAVAAGLISDALIRKGWSAGRSRTVLVTISGLVMSFPALFAFSRDPGISFLFAILSLTAGQGLFAVLYTALVDAVPGRGIILGAALSGWLSGLMSKVANMMTEPISSRSGSGPLLIGFSILTLLAIICVRPLIRRMPAELVPA
jgi:MFS transporter, ACS family, hexuronate transporter